MNNRFFILLQTAILVIVLGLGITGCGSVSDGAGPANGSTEYVIRLGHSDTEDNLINVSLQHYAEYVKEQTGGRVVIRLYPNEELGDNTDMAQQLVTGQLDAMMMPQGVEATYAPKIATLGLPFLFTSYEQAWAVMDDEEIAAYLRAVLSRDAFDHSGLIYGIGHAIYSVSDPRAEILKVFARYLSAEKHLEKEYELYRAVERLAPGVIAERSRMYKGVSANVDFFSGFVYQMLGLPTELYTPIFAIARSVGWSAHRMEELTNRGKIIRPAYEAVAENTEYVPLDKR